MTVAGSGAAGRQSPGELRPGAAIHVDLDGGADIYAGHGWTYPYADDPIFETGMRNMLALFDEAGVRATLFLVARSLDDPRKRALVDEACARGHEIACHSLSHRLLLGLGREERQREIAHGRQVIEDRLGREVCGFRAPGYRIDRECLDLVAEAGYTYDSSIFPTRIYERRTGIPLERLTAPHHPVEGSALLELPLPDHRPSPVPINPTYALLVGWRYFRWGIARLARRDAPLMVLFHLIDAADPLPRERLSGPMTRLFTLSFLGAEDKCARCLEMLGLLRNHYRITTTAEIVADWSQRAQPVGLAARRVQQSYGV